MIAVGAATGPASNSTASTPGQADQLFYETRNNRVIAHGNVEIYYNNFILTADQVIDDRSANELVAEGSEQLKNPDGAITRSDRLRLTDDFRDAFRNALVEPNNRKCSEILKNAPLRRSQKPFPCYPLARKGNHGIGAFGPMLPPSSVPSLPPVKHAPVRTAPTGHEFFYNTGALRLISAIVRKATGRPLNEFARATLFEPLGITSVNWNRVRGKSMPEEDCACDRAIWRKSASWSLRAGAGKTVRSSLKAESKPPRTRKIEATGGLSYGYLWWLSRSPLNGREIHWAGSLGRGGQSNRIVPELDLVVVVTAGYYQDYSPQAFQVQSGAFRDVLRAIPSPV